jgi:flagellar basal body P-ring formation protein FlgA
VKLFKQAGVIVAAFASFAGPVFADALILRAAPQAQGRVITLGDIFENAGAAAERAIAPAPAAGQVSAMNAAFIARAVAAAGHTWSPEPGQTVVEVAGPGAPVIRTSGAGAPTAQRGAAVIRRGDAVTIEITRPGITLTLRAVALSDAAEGAPIRLRNPTSGRTLDAIATGPGEARLSGLAPQQTGTR